MTTFFWTSKCGILLCLRSVGLLRSFICPFVRSFVTTISRERLEQSQWNLHRVFNGPCWWSDYILEVKDQRLRSQQAVAKASTWTLRRRSQNRRRNGRKRSKRENRERRRKCGRKGR